MQNKRVSLGVLQLHVNNTAQYALNLVLSTLPFWITWTLEWESWDLSYLPERCVREPPEICDHQRLYRALLPSFTPAPLCARIHICCTTIDGETIPWPIYRCAFIRWVVTSFVFSSVTLQNSLVKQVSAIPTLSWGEQLLCKVVMVSPQWVLYIQIVTWVSLMRIIICWPWLFLFLWCNGPRKAGWIHAILSLSACRRLCCAALLSWSLCLRLAVSHIHLG